MTTMQIAGELLRASAEDRTLTYRLLPYTAGNTNLGKVLASAGCLTLPDNPADAYLNDRHIAGRDLGHGARFAWESDALVASFRIDEGPAGDDLLAEAALARAGAPAGVELRASASVEVDNPIIRGGKLVGGLLRGAAACVRPAFTGATLLAADVGDLPDDFPEYLAPTESSSESTEEIVVNGVTYVVKRTSTSKTEVEPKNPAEEPPAVEADPSAGSENDMTTGLTASAAAAAGVQPLHTGGNGTEQLTAGQAFRMLASAFRTPSAKNTQLLAALTNVVHDDGDNDGDGLGEITAAPGWLGQVWEEAPYERIYIPLIANGNLTSYREVGFDIATKPKVQKYAGNKAEVPTGGMTATPKSYLVERWAHAADIDRRYIDFGDSEVLKAFTELQVESYKEETDLDVAAYIASTATAGTMPVGAPAGLNEALVALIHGAFSLITKRRRPSFAIIGADVYEPILYLVEDDLPAFLSKSFGLDRGVFENITIVPSAETPYTSKVVVGDGRTRRFKELGGGVPVRVEAEHVANGGKDFGVFGYTSFQNLKADGVVSYDLSV